MNELQRLTTEYIDTEDRIRVSGELTRNETVVMWINQRLLLRLLPHLFGWLEKQTGDSIPSNIVQSFAQEAAKADLATEPPVTQHISSREWLVLAVDVSPTNEALQLVFRAKKNEDARLTMTPIALRQWLAILHTVWGLADWPKELWPNWIKDKATQASTDTQTQFH